MKDISKSELASILDKYDEDLASRQKAAQKSKTEDEIFLSEFQRIRKEVIRPIMEELGTEVRTRGHEYKIEEKEETTDSEGKTSDAAIVMKVYPKDVDRMECLRTGSTPYVGFGAVRYKKKVFAYCSNIAPGRGGSSGPSVEYDVSQIVPEVAEREVVRGLTHIFSRRESRFSSMGKYEEA